MEKRTPGILTKKDDGSWEYKTLNEWQLCPKCNGGGTVLTGMVHNSVDTCDLCNGKKIISKLTGNPPE